ncbi:hypothetical protein HK102_003779 [Quaeritorhiza haematococci]|nr:hypothetical protein HK102_003779 [Quaeritorhiza haematococci]
MMNLRIQRLDSLPDRFSLVGTPLVDTNKVYFFGSTPAPSGTTTNPPAAGTCSNNPSSTTTTNNATNPATTSAAAANNNNNNNNVSTERFRGVLNDIDGWYPPPTRRLNRTNADINTRTPFDTLYILNLDTLQSSSSTSAPLFTSVKCVGAVAPAIPPKFRDQVMVLWGNSIIVVGRKIDTRTGGGADLDYIYQNRRLPEYYPSTRYNRNGSQSTIPPSRQGGTNTGGTGAGARAGAAAETGAGTGVGAGGSSGSNSNRNSSRNNDQIEVWSLNLATKRWLQVAGGRGLPSGADIRPVQAVLVPNINKLHVFWSNSSIINSAHVLGVPLHNHTNPSQPHPLMRAFLSAEEFRRQNSTTATTGSSPSSSTRRGLESLMSSVFDLQTYEWADGLRYNFLKPPYRLDSESTFSVVHFNGALWWYDGKGTVCKVPLGGELASRNAGKRKLAMTDVSPAGKGKAKRPATSTDFVGASGNSSSSSSSSSPIEPPPPSSSSSSSSSANPAPTSASGPSTSATSPLRPQRMMLSSSHIVTTQGTAPRFSGKHTVTILGSRLLFFGRMNHDPTPQRPHSKNRRYASDYDYVGRLPTYHRLDPQYVLYSLDTSTLTWKRHEMDSRLARGTQSHPPPAAPSQSKPPNRNYPPLSSRFTLNVQWLASVIPAPGGRHSRTLFVFGKHGTRSAAAASAVDYYGFPTSTTSTLNFNNFKDVAALKLSYDLGFDLVDGGSGVGSGSDGGGQSLEGLLNQEQFADVDVVTGDGRRVRAHRVILASRW